MIEEEMEIVCELEKYEMKLLVNCWNEKIDWNEKVMIGYLFEFFQLEGLIFGFDVNVDKVNVIDYYCFSIKNKNGNFEEMYVIGLFIDLVRVIMCNFEYFLSFGMWQGGKKDCSCIDFLDVVMQIINKIGVLGFNMKFLKSKCIEDMVWLFKDKMRQFEFVLLKFVCLVKIELFDFDLGGIIVMFMLVEFILLVFIDLFFNDMNYGMKECDCLFNGMCFISLDEFNV